MNEMAVAMRGRGQNYAGGVPRRRPFPRPCDAVSANQCADMPHTLKSRRFPVKGPSEGDKQARKAIAATEGEVRGKGKPGPRKQSSIGPVKTKSRKTNPVKV